MMGETILDAMAYIDDDLIDEVGTLRIRKIGKARHIWMRAIAAAACLCIVLGGLFASALFNNLIKSASGDGASPEAQVPDNIYPEKYGVTIPMTEVSLKPNATGDMINFFIYEGRVYRGYERVEGNPALAGEYLGTVTGMIDEWTPADGYVNYAGTGFGDFYTVNGYDPSFLLCMKKDDGTLRTFISDNGLTLYRGSDFYEDLLHLSGNYTAAEYLTRRDFELSIDESKPIPAEAEAVLHAFLAALNHGYFMYTDDVILTGEQERFDDLVSHVLVISMNNGLTVHLRLFEGGYVCFGGQTPVCVQMDLTAFSALTEIME